jgi:hypothetical protein
MLGMRRPGSLFEMHAPQRLEHRPGRVAGDVTIAGQFVRERAHVAGALHVVLPPQRVHADAGAADIAGGHGEVGNGDHRGRALAVLGDAEPVIDRPVAAGRIEAGGGADRLGRNAGNLGYRFRAVAGLGDERRPVLEFVPVAPLAHEDLVDETLRHDNMSERGEHRDIGARQQRQVMRGLHVGRAHEIDAARIDHDQLRPLAQALLHARGEHGMGVGRIGADQHDDIGLLDRIEILSPGRSPERSAQPVAGRRMADPRAGVHIVVAEAAADQLLHQEGLLVGAA